MNNKRTFRFIVTFAGICIALIVSIGLISNLSIVKDWQIQHSVTIIEGATRIFENTRQYSGNYKQKNLYYWSPRPLSEIRQFYQDFSIAPFIETNSNDESWLIAALRGSDTIANPVRKVSQHSDLCDYHKVFSCTSIALFDASRLSLGTTLQSLYSITVNDVQSLPNSGTLIVFSYNIPDPA